MLQTLKYKLSERRVDDDQISWILNLLAGISHMLLFFITPEDSSKDEDKDMMEIRYYRQFDIAGGIKALFWLPISFLLAVLITRLQ